MSCFFPCALPDTPAATAHRRHVTVGTSFSSWMSTDPFHPRLASLIVPFRLFPAHFLEGGLPLPSATRVHSMLTMSPLTMSPNCADKSMPALDSTNTFSVSSATPILPLRMSAAYAGGLHPSIPTRVSCHSSLLKLLRSPVPL